MRLYQKVRPEDYFHEYKEAFLVQFLPERELVERIAESIVSGSTEPTGSTESDHLILFPEYWPINNYEQYNRLAKYRTNRQMGHTFEV